MKIQTPVGSVTTVCWIWAKSQLLWVVQLREQSLVLLLPPNWQLNIEFHDARTQIQVAPQQLAASRESASAVPRIPVFSSVLTRCIPCWCNSIAWAYNSHTVSTSIAKAWGSEGLALSQRLWWGFKSASFLKNLPSGSKLFRQSRVWLLCRNFLALNDWLVVQPRVQNTRNNLSDLLCTKCHRSTNT